MKVAGAIRAAVTDAGNAADRREACDRHRVVERRERRLHVPANTGVQREGRRHAPGVLDERRVVVQLPVTATLSEERILVGVRIERRLPGDGRHAPGQHRVEGARAGQLVG